MEELSRASQSLLQPKTGTENGCSCFSWIHCKMLWDWGKLFSLVLENTGFQILIPYFMLGSEPSALAMGNVKQLRSIRHDQNYDLIVQGQCQQRVIRTCQTRKQKSFCLEGLFLYNLQLIWSQISTLTHLNIPSRHPLNFAVFEISSGF